MSVNRQGIVLYSKLVFKMQVQTDILSTLSDFTWLKQTVTRDLHSAFGVDFSLSSNISPKSKNCAKLDICTAQHDKPSVSNLLAQSLFNIIFSPRKIKYRKKGHFVVMQLKLEKGPFSKSTIRENSTQIFCFGELQYNITKTFLLRKFLCQRYLFRSHSSNNLLDNNIFITNCKGTNRQIYMHYFMYFLQR